VYDQTDVWVYTGKKKENTELRELLALKPVSLVTKKTDKGGFNMLNTQKLHINN